MRRLHVTVALVVLVAASLALTAAAWARNVDVPARLGAEIPDAAAIDVPVLLPSKADLDVDAATRLYPDGTSRKGTYTLTLSGAPDCGEANACFLASFTGKRGARLGTKANVTLALGTKGAYRGLRCGASCSPPSIAWVQKGVRYEIQAKALGGRAAFVRMANSAIRAGNRG